MTIRKLILATAMIAAGTGFALAQSAPAPANSVRSQREPDDTVANRSVERRARAATPRELRRAGP